MGDFCDKLVLSKGSKIEDFGLKPMLQGAPYQSVSYGT
jgi:hypothetical protein